VGTEVGERTSFRVPTVVDNAAVATPNAATAMVVPRTMAWEILVIEAILSFRRLNRPTRLSSKELAMQILERRG
jgi:hypothetical protein